MQRRWRRRRHTKPLPLFSLDLAGLSRPLSRLRLGRLRRPASGLECECACVLVRKRAADDRQAEWNLWRQEGRERRRCVDTVRRGKWSARWRGMSCRWCAFFAPLLTDDGEHDAGHSRRDKPRLSLGEGRRHLRTCWLGLWLRKLKSLRREQASGRERERERERHVQVMCPLSDRGGGGGGGGLFLYQLSRARSWLVA
jgi:hypothetical protein